MAQHTSRPIWFWIIPINVVVIALITVFILFIDEDDHSGRQAGAQAGAASAGASQTSDTDRIDDRARRDVDDPMSLGQVNAPVVMVIYSDYQCDYCAAFSDESQTQLIEKYVNTGQLRMEWRDVSVFGEDSNRAAKAAYAAGQQNNFVEYHNALFADGKRREPAQLSEKALIKVAEELGLVIDQFKADFTSEKTAAAVEENMNEAVELGAFSTPTFLINGEAIVGAQPIAEFEKAIERAKTEAPYQPASN